MNGRIILEAIDAVLSISEVIFVKQNEEAIDGKKEIHSQITTFCVDFGHSFQSKSFKHKM